MEFVVHCWIWCTALLNTGEALKVLGNMVMGVHSRTQKSGSSEDGIL